MKSPIIISVIILCFFQKGIAQTKPLLQKYMRFENNV